MAKLIKPDGTISEIKPLKGNHFTLEELQGYIHGYIELVSTKDGKQMYIDEEGKIKKLDLNEKATMLYSGADFDCIFGTAIVCDNDEIE